MSGPASDARPGASAPAQSRLPVWLCLLVLALGVLLAYADSVDGALVFDDRGAILNNATIRELWPPSRVLSPPIDGLPVTGRPITNLSFALNYAAHGTAAPGYRLVNIAIHLGCAVGLFALLRRTYVQPRLAGRFGAHATALSLAAALVWAVHPLQTAAVTYVSQRAESLASGLVLFALYAFIRSATSRRRIVWLGASAVACWIGVGTKEFCAAIPLLVALYDRTFTSASWREAWQRHRWYYVALTASWLPLAWLIQSTENRGSTWAADAGFGALEYARIQTGALWRYVQLVGWPNPLVFDYGRNLPVPSWPFTAVAGGAVLAGLWITVVGLRRQSAAALCGAVFFAILAPTSSFVPIADPMFEHRMYLPSAALIVLALTGAYRAATGLALPAMAVIALALLPETVDRNRDYRSAEVLWRDTVAKRPDNARARGNLGEELMRQHRFAEALPHFEAAYRLTPGLPIVPHNLANALDMLGRREEAIPHYREALRLQPRNFLSRTNLANALAEAGALAEALALYEALVTEVPEFADARTGYGKALLRSKRIEEAIVQFRRAAELRPEHAEAYFNLGDALARAGQLDQAVAAFRAAVRLQPNYFVALNNLGNALLLTRQVSEAAATFEAALRIKRDAMTHTNLGMAYLLLRDQARAVAQFEAALALDPGHVAARSALQRLQGGR